MSEALTRLQGHNALLSGTAAVIGAVSYATTVVMAHLVPSSGYIAFAAVVSLLATAGITAEALVPLPLAAAVRQHPAGSPSRRQGLAFAVTVSMAGGVVAAVVLGAVTALFAGPAIVAVCAAAAFALFATTPTWGLLLGESRVGTYAVTKVVEVTVRATCAVTAIVLGWSVGSALGSFLIGFVVVTAVGLRAGGSDLGWQPNAMRDRSRWLETSGLAAVQLSLSGLGGLDIVLAAVVVHDPTSAAGYQAIAALTKGPLYVAAGAILISYPLLRAGGDRAGEILRACLRSFARLAVPTTAVLATVPVAVAAIALPRTYLGSLRELPWLAVAGFGYATLTVVVLTLLSRGAAGRCTAAVVGAVVVHTSALLIGWRLGSTHGLAVGSTIGALTAATVAGLAAAPLLPRWCARTMLRGLAATGLLITALLLARPSPVGWLTVAVAAGVVVVRGALARPAGRRSGPERAQPAGCFEQLQILHLGFEDPAMPGAGGGSLRTHEINRRLTGEHQITVLTTRFPGCRDRIQDGVRYVHIGVGTGRTRLTRLLGYVLLLPLCTRRYPADIVIEDFFAPISTLAAPLWTGRPTIGMVQWLNAREKARQYHLPFHLLERAGVRRHRRLIAVSDDLADRLRVMNPRAEVDVVANGVDRAAFEPEHRLGQDVVFIGRLEIAQKGVDLLLQTWALAAPHLTGHLIIAGTGPDEQRLRRMVAELGLADRVRFVGWVSGAAKYALLADARLAVVPSRFETFGIVAVEALATATPVLAFDIACLRAVVPARCGRRVPAFDVHAFADALVAAYTDSEWLLSAGRAGRTFAAGYDWDALAQRQLVLYTTALQESS